MALKRSLLALLAVLVVAQTGVSAAQTGVSAAQAAPMATVRQFVDGFNKGDTKTALATCASPASIIDEFAPHLWQGPNACADWARDLDASDKAAGISGGIVTLGRPWTLTITNEGDSSYAYVVVPTTYAYKLHGKLQVESGSVWTLTLKKTDAGWRITAWAWAKH